MPLGTYGAGLGPYWGLLLPVEQTNLVTNPSFELGTTGWGTIQAGTIGTTSGFQAFGAWAGSIAPTSNGTAGAFGGAFTASNGSAYTVSAYVRGATNIPYRLAVGDSGGLNFVGSTTFTGGGTWQRYAFSYTEPAGAARTVVLTKNSSADTSAIYLDGVNVVMGSLTTYLDGDQDGCTWLGQAHASQSYRSGSVRSGGSIVALDDLGLFVTEYPGVGMPPMQNNSQSYAVLDGDQYQRTRAAARTFTLTGEIIGANQQDFHAQRRKLINALKIDAVSPQQPTRFIYIGAGGTSYIDAVYKSGLEYSQPSGQFAESVAIQFDAFDPYWRSERDVGTALAGYTNIGSANNITYRDPLGRWGTLQGGFVGGGVYAMAEYNGTVYLGGEFLSANGSNARIAEWSNGTLGTIGGPDGNVYALTLTPTGTLFTGGMFTTLDGTVGARRIGLYAGGKWGTLLGGTTADRVFALAYTTTGTLFAGGSYGGAGGTAGARHIAQYVNGAWGTLTNGTLNEAVYTIAYSQWGSLYVGGAFGSAGGTAAANVAQYNGTWGTMGVGLGSAGAAGSSVRDLAIAPDASIYATGQFQESGVTSASTVWSVARWTGVGWSAVGSGIQDQFGGAGIGYALLIGSNGQITVGGGFRSAGRVLMPDSQAQWLTGAWTPIDIDLASGQQNVLSYLRSATGTTYVGGIFAGTSNAASVAQVTNPGMAQAWPIVTIRNTGAGTARIFQFGNTLTGDMIYFNLSLLGGETATLDLSPDSRTFTSDFRGNIMSVVLPSSNFANVRLLPGTNYLSFFADTTTVTASLSFRQRHWSADGTI